VSLYRSSTIRQRMKKKTHPATYPVSPSLVTPPLSASTIIIFIGPCVGRSKSRRRRGTATVFVGAAVTPVLVLPPHPVVSSPAPSVLLDSILSSIFLRQISIVPPPHRGHLVVNRPPRRRGSGGTPALETLLTLWRALFAFLASALVVLQPLADVSAKLVFLWRRVSASGPLMGRRKWGDFSWRGSARKLRGKRRPVVVVKVGRRWSLVRREPPPREMFSSGGQRVRGKRWAMCTG